MPSAKPVLVISTPVTADFPRDVPRELPSAGSLETPMSAKSPFREALPSAGLPSAGLPSAGLSQAVSPTGPMSARIKSDEKTPITPPLAYLDFLRSMSLSSPPLSGKALLARTSTYDSTTSESSTTTVDSTASEREKEDSPPSSAASEGPEPCNDKNATSLHSPNTTRAGRTLLPTGRGVPPGGPLSAPPVGASPSCSNLPASPAIFNCSKVDSPRSPWSARSVRSHFDWDAALKARKRADTIGCVATASRAGSAGCGSKRETRSVRHIREVVTRTVTYTPRMAPPPKGKRRKVDHDTAS
ncbi:hypothetical protein VTK73DRAFT_9402 [Phialemonium thermophilum]|uniref:Uncharacterized protein n=1 Tax=Phialemonium thermophilum TaxID=223376 RepID=A0ABR3XLN4_9PEZI